MSNSAKFIQAILDKRSADALLSTISNDQVANGIVFPRMVYSWIDVTQSYSGTIPGHDNELVFKKTEDGYTGHVDIGGSLYKFENSSIFNVVGGISVALDITGFDAGLKPKQLSQLCKNIDLLVKSSSGSKLADIRNRAKAKLQKTAFGGKVGPPQAPVELQPPKAPENTQTPSLATKPESKVFLKIKKPQLPKPKSPITEQINQIGKSECTKCLRPLFKGEQFVGCYCLKDVIYDCKLWKSEDELFLEPGKSWTKEDLKVLEPILVDKNGQ